MIALLLSLASLSFAGDAPEISRSVGELGGSVVLWPRVIPRSESPTARAAGFVVQQELKRLVAEVSTAAVDVRPEPERVCPQTGCKAIALGAVLVHQKDACVVVATISLPGRSDQVLVPWAGAVDLKAATVPFREPPESLVTIRDFASCSGLKVTLAENEAGLKAALTKAMAAR